MSVNPIFGFTMDECVCVQVAMQCQNAGCIDDRCLCRYSACMCACASTGARAGQVHVLVL